jgi:uncharacterized protein YprB with RNaseH-like and TPR domain
MISRVLRQRLGDLLRQGSFWGASSGSEGKAGPSHVVTSAARPEPCVIRAGIEDILPGGVIEGADGSLFIHERLYNEIGENPGPLLERFAALCEPAASNGSSDAAHANGNRSRAPRPTERRIVYDLPRPARTPPMDLPGLLAQVEWPERGLFRRFGFRRMLFLDIETCGLSGVPVFLVGLALIGEEPLVLRQLFARDYTEERALLGELGRLLGEFDFLVTFNGKSFDIPFLRDRAAHHRMSLRLELPHLDLLWMARRRWKAVLPDCKLKTLEWHVLRRRRAGDVWGYEIPGLYHDYVQRGEPHRLIPIFHHNMLDVVAMVELIPAVFDPDTEVY